jgi:hypothetical protein
MLFARDEHPGRMLVLLHGQAEAPQRDSPHRHPGRKKGACWATRARPSLAAAGEAKKKASGLRHTSGDLSYKTGGAEPQLRKIKSRFLVAAKARRLLGTTTGCRRKVRAKTRDRLRQQLSVADRDGPLSRRQPRIGARPAPGQWHARFPGADWRGDRSQASKSCVW